MSFSDPSDPRSNECNVMEDEREDTIIPPLINGYSTQDVSLSTIKIEKTSPTPTTTTSPVSLLPSIAEPPTVCISRPQKGYQPKTISNDQQHKRWSILPTFPTLEPEEVSSTHLLLSNVPLLALSCEQRDRRQHGCDDLICYENATHSPCTKQGTRILYQCFRRLSVQWHVPLPLLIFNYERMVSSMSHLSLDDFVGNIPSFELTIEEWKLALEFYLQMDVDCFFLKTCSFNGSTPRLHDYITYTETEGLFCLDLPEALYGTRRCHYDKCLFCHVPDRNHRLVPAFDYDRHQTHTFVNHYRTLLNCNVTCFSSNILYTLTCPCQHYDYIGRASGAFYKRLYFHRVHCSRIIREFLLGESIVHRNHSSSPPSKESKKTNSMDLYRHIVHCHVALQTFLNYHFVYGCLVPMTLADADRDDQQVPGQERQSNFLLQQFTEDKFNQASATQESRSDEVVNWYRDNLPAPPRNYRFSKRQRQEQYYFFKAKIDLWPLSHHFDIYKATIVIALPHPCSSHLLHFVQALLVTHAECQLNTSTARIPSHFDRSINWCENLTRPASYG